MALIAPSPVWSALARLRWQRVLISVVIVAVCVEAVARAAPLIVPKTVRQPFTMLTTRGLDGTDVEWQTNEVGARGAFRRPGPAIATFGTSTTAGSGITQLHTWPEEVKTRLCGAVSVDNFARDAASWPEAEAIMADLARKGRHYDAAIIMTHINPGAAPTSDPFNAWSRYNSGSAVFAAPLLLKRAFLRKFHETEAHLPLVKQIADEARATLNPPAPGFHHPQPLDKHNLQLRASGAVMFADRPTRLTAEERARIAKRSTDLVALAKTIATYVFVMTQPVAYDADAVPGVAKHWISLYPLAPDRPLYLSNRAVAEQIRLQQGVVAKAAEAAGATIIPLDEAIRPKLATTDRLFFDKWHFTPEGTAVAANIIVPYLRTVPQIHDRCHRGG